MYFSGMSRLINIWYPKWCRCFMWGVFFWSYIGHVFLERATNWTRLWTQFLLEVRILGFFEAPKCGKKLLLSRWIVEIPNLDLRNLFCRIGLLWFQWVVGISMIVLHESGVVGSPWNPCSICRKSLNHSIFFRLWGRLSSVGITNQKNKALSRSPFIENLWNFQVVGIPDYLSNSGFQWLVCRIRFWRPQGSRIGVIFLGLSSFCSDFEDPRVVELVSYFWGCRVSVCRIRFWRPQGSRIGVIFLGVVEFLLFFHYFGTKPREIHDFHTCSEKRPALFSVN